MKKTLFLIGTAMLFFCMVCSKEDATLSKNEETDIEIDTNEETVKTDNNTAKEIIELECYVESFQCGYVSYADVLREGVLLISSEEELAQAEKNDCLTVIEEGWTNNTIAEAFAALKENYPIEDYVYLIEYRETVCGGYYFHADKVGILEDRIGFLLDEEESPGPNEAATEEMGGFCHMAAIPKAEIEGKTFVNVVYP